MRRVDLTHVNLTRADLAGADLTEANFSHSDLKGARLSYSMLVSALFNGVDLREADLHSAELALAAFNGALLSGADLTRAHFSRTVIARCHDLHQAIGLAAVEHVSPSAIDLETLRRCGAGLPDGFLAGVGVERAEVDALRAATTTG
jgi:uncharacterized protein YjbI with pentapeptide repeats